MADVRTCRKCGGNGFIKIPNPYYLPGIMHERVRYDHVTCSACEGEGKYYFCDVHGYSKDTSGLNARYPRRFSSCSQYKECEPDDKAYKKLVPPDD